jgi:nitric-oxide synthase
LVDIQYPTAPFSGWYSLPEVATRNLLDKQRYNMSLDIANALKLDTESKTNLWQDQVNIETNIAVLHSYTRDQVTIVDHHTQVILRRHPARV